MAVGMIRAFAPTRIDFVGGWTDVQPFCDDEPGLVVNAAFALRTRVTVRPSAAAAPSRNHFVAAAHKRFPLQAVEIELGSEAPVGAGLGGSGAAGVALVGGLAAAASQDFTRSEIAEMAHQIEMQDLGVIGGKQDQYAAAYGGFLALTFQGEIVTVEPIELSDARRAELAAHSIVAYTGQARVSGNVHARVQEAYRQRLPETLAALATIRRVAQEFRDALADGSFDALGDLLSENWEAQKKLHPATTNASMEALFDAARAAGAAGGKALGAGGGGCLYFLVNEGQSARVEAALQAAGAAILPTRFDLEGLRIESQA